MTFVRVSLDYLLSPAAMRSLGWALLHFLWQGTALAALAAVAMGVCRKAAVRYAMGVGVLVLMLAAPVATFLFDRHVASVATPVSGAPLVPILVAVQGPNLTPVSSLSGVPHFIAPGSFPFPWLVEAWLVGVLFFSLRCAGGVLLLERMRRRQVWNVNARMLKICLTLQRRLRLGRAIRYCECTWLQAPAVIGWFRPIVLLPVTALTGLSEDQLEGVIAHELAHIKRLDAFVNAFQIAAETILFYHPAIWWLNGRIRAERENACDDVAVVLCGNAVEYAHALTLMEEWRSAPMLAMAANRGPLTARIMRLLGLSNVGLGMRGLGVAASLLCLTGALVVGGTTIGISRPRAVAQSVAPAPSAVAPSIRSAGLAEPRPAAKAASATKCRRSAFRPAQKITASITAKASSSEDRRTN